MSTTLWVIITMVALMLMGLAFTVGWILARNEEHDYHRLVQLGMGAVFVGVALTIVIVQAKLVVSHQKVIACNTQLINALVLRNKAQTDVNSAGVHFHEHMLIWLDTEINEAHQFTEKDATDQLREAIQQLIDARNAAIRVEQSNPLHDCR